MADERVRRLEHVLEPDDVLARARLLRERVRTGELPLERLELAAYLGDAAARLATPSPRDGADSGADSGADGEPDLEAWVSGLARFGPDLVARAALVAARHALPDWECWGPGELAPGTVLREAIDAAAAWRRAPDVEGAEQVRAALARAEATLEQVNALLALVDVEHRAVSPAGWAALEAGWAVLGALNAAGPPPDDLGRLDPARVAWSAAACVRAHGGDLAESERTLRHHLRARLADDVGAGPPSRSP